MHPSEIQRMFDRLVDHYERLNHRLSLRIDHYWRRQTLRYLKPPVLDLCCGTGEVAALLHRFGLPGGVGLDFSEAMLRRARARWPNAQWVRADALALPFANGQFQTATCFFGLRNIAQPRRLFAEVYRVLRPGGRWVILDMILPEAPVRWPYSLYLRHLLPRLAALWGAPRADYEYLAESIHRLPVTEIRGLLQATGFALVDTRSLLGGTAGLWIAHKPPDTSVRVSFTP